MSGKLLRILNQFIPSRKPKAIQLLITSIASGLFSMIETNNLHLSYAANRASLKFVYVQSLLNDSHFISEVKKSDRSV